MKPQWYSGAIFGLLTVMAGLLVWQLLGGNVPRVAFAGLIVAQGALRVLRDRDDPQSRNRSVVNFVISLGLAALIVTAT